MNPHAVGMIIAIQIPIHTPIIIVVDTALYHLAGGRGHGFPIHVITVITGLAPGIIMDISMDMDIFIMMVIIMVIMMAIGGDIMMGGGIVEGMITTIAIGGTTQ